MLNGSALTHQKLRGYIDAEPMNFSLQYSDHCLERQKTLIPTGTRVSLAVPPWLALRKDGTLRISLTHDGLSPVTPSTATTQ
jgi:hypothetical protein